MPPGIPGGPPGIMPPGPAKPDMPGLCMLTMLMGTLLFIMRLASHADWGGA
jgi:hypothetical protein